MNEKLLILGAGHQGLAMAAHFSLSGESVNLWNRSAEHISFIAEEHCIVCDGVVNGVAHIDDVSTDMSALISRTIFVTTPSTAYKDIAMQLAPILLPDSVIFLNPGRTFGAVEFLKTLQENNCPYDVTVAETQSIVYTCRRTERNEAYIFALKNHVKMATIGKTISETALFARIPECIRNKFCLVNSFLETSLGNVGMVLHCAPVLMNIGWIESKQHSFYYYYDGISPTVGAFLEQVDKERLNVSKALNVDTPSIREWFKICYNVTGESIYDCIQKNEYYRTIDAPKTISHRYLDEDVPNGLVPIEYLGRELGVEVRYISLVIDIACAVRNVDYRSMGRRYSLNELKLYLHTEV